MPAGRRIPIADRLFPLMGTIFISLARGMKIVPTRKDTAACTPVIARCGWKFISVIKSDIPRRALPRFLLSSNTTSPAILAPGVCSAYGSRLWSRQRQTSSCQCSICSRWGSAGDSRPHAVQSTEALCQRPERTAVPPQKRQVSRSSGQSAADAVLVGEAAGIGSRWPGFRGCACMVMEYGTFRKDRQPPRQAKVFFRG